MSAQILGGTKRLDQTLKKRKMAARWVPDAEIKEIAKEYIQPIKTKRAKDWQRICGNIRDIDRIIRA